MECARRWSASRCSRLRSLFREPHSPARKAGQPFPTNLYTSPTPRRRPACASTCRSRIARRTRTTVRTSTSSTRWTASTSSLGSRSRSTARSTCARSRARPSSSSGPGGQVIGPNQLVWEPAANTLHVESDRAARPGHDLPARGHARRARHRREPLDETDFRHDLNRADEGSADEGDRKALLDALPMAMAGGANPNEIAAASLFTTQSITRSRGKIRAQLTAAAVNFTLGTSGERTVFPLSSVRGHLGRQIERRRRPSPPAASSCRCSPASGRSLRVLRVARTTRRAGR